MSEENGAIIVPVSYANFGSRHSSYTSHTSRITYTSHADLFKPPMTKERQLRSRSARNYFNPSDQRYHRDVRHPDSSNSDTQTYVSMSHTHYYLNTNWSNWGFRMITTRVPCPNRNKKWTSAVTTIRKNTQLSTWEVNRLRPNICMLFISITWILNYSSNDDQFEHKALKSLDNVCHNLLCYSLLSNRKYYILNVYLFFKLYLINTSTTYKLNNI